MARLEKSLTDFFDTKKVKEIEHMEIDSEQVICSKSSAGRLSQGEANLNQPAKTKYNVNRTAKTKAPEDRLPLNKSSRTLVTHSKTDNANQQSVKKKPNCIRDERVQNKSSNGSLAGSGNKRAQNSESVCPMPDAILTTSPCCNNNEPSSPALLSPHDAEYYSDDFTSASVASECATQSKVRQCHDSPEYGQTTFEQLTPGKPSSDNVQSKIVVKSARPETPYVIRQVHELRNRKMSDHKARLQTGSYAPVMEGAVDLQNISPEKIYSATTVPSLPSIYPTGTYGNQKMRENKKPVILPEIDGESVGLPKATGAVASRARILPSTAVLQSGRLDMTITMPIATQRKGDRQRARNGFPSQMTVTFVNRVIPFQASAPTHHGINRVTTPSNRGRHQRYGQSSNKKKMSLLAATKAASEVRARAMAQINGTDADTNRHITWLPHPDSATNKDVVKNRSFWPPFDTSQSMESRQRYLNNFLDM